MNLVAIAGVPPPGAKLISCTGDGIGAWPGPDDEPWTWMCLAALGVGGVVGYLFWSHR